MKKKIQEQVYTCVPNSKNILKCPFLHQLYTIRYKYKNTFLAGMTQEFISIVVPQNKN